MGDVYLLSTQEYREWVRIHEESPSFVRGDFQSPQPSLEQIPSLVSVVRQIVNGISSQQQVSSTKETLSTEEAAKRLDCSPAWVRELAKSGKLPFILRGKNFKFRQVDIDAYQASETRSGADMRKNSRKRLSVQNDGHKIEAKEKEEKKSESEEVFPSREEIKKICRS